MSSFAPPFVVRKVLIAVVVLLACAVGASSAQAGLSRTVAAFEAKAAIIHYWASREWTERWSFSGCSRRGSGFTCEGSVSGPVKRTNWYDPPPMWTEGIRCSDYWGPDPNQWPAHCDRTNGWYDSDWDGHGDPGWWDDPPGGYVTIDATKSCYLKVKVRLRGFFPKTRTIPSCRIR
jgi:hypothetical protein